MSDGITVIVADDHPLFRAGVRGALQADPSLRVVGEAGDGLGAMRLIETLAPAVAVLDIDMPGMSGLDILGSIVERKLATRIVLLTMHESADLLQRAIGGGVAGYLLKDSAVSDILACVHYVQTGRTYIAPALSQHLVSKVRAVEMAAGTADPFAALSPGERRVVKLVAEGKSSKEVASALGLSVKTVDNHRSNACAKLGLRGTHSLVRFALDHRDHLV